MDAGRTVHRPLRDAILQWHGPGEQYDVSRQFDSGFITGQGGTLMHTITGLDHNTEYDIRLVTTRRYAVDGVSAETTVLTPPP